MPAGPWGEGGFVGRVAVRRCVGALLLALASAASLVPPEAVWSPAASRLPALLAAARDWLPVALAVALVGALAGALLARSGRLAGWSERLARSCARGGWLVAIGAGLGVGVVAGFVFDASPMHVDAVVQAFQANLLRGGAATAPAPAHPEFFAALNTAIRDGRWIGQFPPGFPALLALAPGGWGRALLAALVAAWAVYAVYRAGTALYGAVEACLAALLVAASPFALLLSASGLNHAAAAAAAATVFWLATSARIREASSGARALAIGGGIALGAMITIRPLDGAVVGALVAPLVVAGPGGRSRALGLLAGVGPALLLLGAYDRAVTGSAFQLGYTFVWGPAHGLGFHVSPWGEPHTLARGLFDLERDLWLLDRDAFGRALPLLAAAALPFVLDSGRGATQAMRSAEAVLAGLVLALPATYVFYWHHDWFLGPRYLFTIFPFFALLASRGIVLVSRRLAGRPIARGAWIGVLAAGAFWLLAVEIPSRTATAFALRPDFRVDVAALARAQGIERGVVFVKESWGSRILARLLGRGLSPSEAERLYRRADHCTLERLLADPRADRARIVAEAERDLSRAPSPRPDRARNGDPTLRLRPGPLPALCGDEIAYDRAAPYGTFVPQLARQDPWLRGPLIVARDLRAENARLLAAHPRDAGYLYIPGRLGAPGAFVPLRPGDVRAF